MNYDNTRIFVGNKSLKSTSSCINVDPFPTPPKEQTKDMKVQLATNLIMSLGPKSKFPKLRTQGILLPKLPVWDVFSSMVRRTLNLKPSSTSSMASFKGRRGSEENRDKIFHVMMFAWVFGCCCPNWLKLFHCTI